MMEGLAVRSLVTCGCSLLRIDRPPFRIGFRQKLNRIFRMSMAAIVGSVLFLIAFMGLLYYFQARMIYLPRSYGPEHTAWLPPSARMIPYETSEGRQQAIYVPPRDNPNLPPDPIWMLFNGNASLAMDWADFLEKVPNPRAGFLLIDYPGYGHCEGSPSPRTILESSAKALAALAHQLAAKPDQLYRHLNVLGFSLGTAAALQLACKERVERIVLIAPFSSLVEMARRSVGWPLCNLLTHRFDNRARLDELARSPHRPAVTILHGNADRVVPVEMSRKMAGLYPGWIEYHEVEGGEHNLIFSEAAPQIVSAMFPDVHQVRAVGE
jgi:uncharacterized protein